MDNQELWQTVLTEIELNVSKANFSTWFQDTTIVSAKDGIIVVGVPNIFTKEWLENKYNQYILKILKGTDQSVKSVEYAVEPGLNPIQKTLKTLKRKVFPQKEQLDLSEFEISRETNLNPKYTFENFVVGSFNELAHAAASSVAQNPGVTYNPLFIYGGVGLGKTHLIQATGNELIKTKKKLRIKYLPSEKFTIEMVWAIRNKKIDEFKDKYRQLDVLILDDIQFISGKEKTQDEFFHTFNSLYELNKQIILSSDRPPKAISMLEERLRSRFEGGMIADIGYPDLETRMAILKEKCQQKDLDVSDEVIECIASHIQNNIRELEGALNKITASSILNGKPTSKEEVQRVLKHLISKPKYLTTPKKIFRSVCDFYELGEKDLLEKNRKQEVVKPRQIIMYLLRKELGWSYPSIGLKLGKKDHTTVIYSCAKIESGLRENEGLQEEINLIKQRIYNS